MIAFGKSWRQRLALLLLLAATTAVYRHPAHTTNASRLQAVLPRGKALLAHDHTLGLRELATGEEQTLFSLPATEFVHYPAWLPDGSGIIYVVQHVFTGNTADDFGSDIWRADAEGGNRHVLLAHDKPGADVDGLDVSPDGTWLAFGYIRTDYSPSGALLGQVIRVNRLDLGSNVVSLLVEGAIDPGIGSDGSVAYVDISAADGIANLYVRGADRSTARLILTAAPTFLALFAPRFSPDGTTLLFAAAPDPTKPAVPASSGAWTGGDGPPEDLWIISLNNGTLNRLTTLQEDRPTAGWSADGKQILLTGTSGLFLIRADGTGLSRLGDSYVHAELAWLDR